jgi:hypothetical protein
LSARQGEVNEQPEPGQLVLVLANAERDRTAYTLMVMRGHGVAVQQLLFCCAGVVSVGVPDG